MKSKDSSLNWDFDETPREVVSSLMDGIEKYRRERKTLRQIHTALSKNSSFSLSFASFRNHYYQLRKERNGVCSTRKNAVEKKITSVTFAPPEQVPQRIEVSVDIADELSTELYLPQTHQERLAAHQKLAESEFSK
jgi:hypothetical protein